MNRVRLLAGAAALAVGLAIVLFATGDDPDTVRTASPVADGSESSSPTTSDPVPSDPVSSAEPNDTDVAASPVATDAPPETAVSSPPVTAAATAPSTTPEPPTEPTDAFPCSIGSRQSMVSRLSDLDGVEALADADLYLRTMARSILEVGQVLSEDQRVADLDANFDGFRPFVDGCPPEIDGAFSTGDGFLCQASRLSADDRIHGYLQRSVASKMDGCDYETGFA